MLSHILQAGSSAIVSSDSAEVLAHCPYHNQIIFARAARDAFIDQQGLDDFAEFVVRKDIQDKRKSVGVFEVMYREDMRQFFTGCGRLVFVAKETLELFNTLRKSNNWVTEYKRMQAIEPASFGIHAYTTYGQVMQMYNEGEYEEAGKALATGMFPKKESTATGD